VLFTFPLRYWFAIGLPVVFRLAGWCRRIQTRFLRPRPTQDTAKCRSLFAYGTITLYGADFQRPRLNNRLPHLAVLQPRRARPSVWPLPRSLATTCGITTCFLFLRLLRCFSSAGSRLSSPCLQHGGLPHSDIDGSRVVCTSPSLFAAYRVLRRLREPRHPPCALGLLPVLRRHSSRNASNALLRRKTTRCRADSLVIVPKLRLASKFRPLLLLFIPSLVNELFIGGEYRIRTDDP